MKNYLLKHWTELSHTLGISSGFSIFYLMSAFGYSWEISFTVGFILGFLTSTVFNHVLDKIHDRDEALNLSQAVEVFKKHSEV